MRSISNRNADLASVIKTGVSAGTKSLRCACPGIIQGWNADAQTVTVQLAIKEVLKLDGVETETEIPLLVDVPVVVPRAGGYALLLVPKAGDECLVVFSDMCIDSWWQSGGVQSQAERRRHDLSDGFAILGCWSQVNKPESYPAEGISLQNDDGTVSIRIDSAGCHFTGIDIGVKDLVTQDNGVAVGAETETPTAENKLFQVAESHKSVFYGAAEFRQDISAAGKVSGQLYDENGGYAGGTYSTDTIRIGTWIDGKPIYRKVFTGVALNDDGPTFELGVTVETAIRLYGMAQPDNSTAGSWQPINSYYDKDNYHAYARLNSSTTCKTHAATDMTGFIVLEYTLSDDEV